MLYKGYEIRAVPSMSLNTFEEMIDAPHANAERWRKRLADFEMQKDDKSK